MNEAIQRWKNGVAPWKRGHGFQTQSPQAPPTTSSTALRNLQSAAISQSVPSGYVKMAIENGPFIVDLPMKNGDFP